MFKLQYQIGKNTWMDALLDFGGKVEKAIYANFVSAKAAQRDHESKHRGIKYRVIPA